jgi:hypothetical protein
MDHPMWWHTAILALQVALGVVQLLMHRGNVRRLKSIEFKFNGDHK